LFSFLSQIALETEFDNAPALALYTSLGFVPEKRLHRFYLNGKDAFRLVLPLGSAKDEALGSGATSMPCDKQQLPSALLQLPSRHTTSDDDEDDDDDDADASVVAPGILRVGSKLTSLPPTEDEEDYAENTAKLARLRRRITALRACRMITVWPSEEEEDHVSGR
jgi:hypothetical protein